MGLPAKLVRSQLNFFKPFVANCSLETTRRGQDKLGELMEAIHRRDVIVRDHDFGPFQGPIPPIRGKCPEGTKGVGMLAPKVTERLLQIWYDLSVSAPPSHLPWEGRLCVVYFLISSQYRLAACSVLWSP